MSHTPNKIEEDVLRNATEEQFLQLLIQLLEAKMYRSAIIGIKIRLEGLA